jgi:hypothetical protein
MHWDGRSWKLTDTPTYRFPDPQPPEVSARPSTGEITPQAQQSLWFTRIVPVPGTRKLIAAGHMQVNQRGTPMSKPLIATLEI